MTRHKIHWTEPAIRDLLEMRSWIIADEPVTAERVARSIKETVDHLETLPYRGRPGRVPGTRELVPAGWPWIVVYEVMDDRVMILRALHGHKKKLSLNIELQT